MNDPTGPFAEWRAPNGTDVGMRRCTVGDLSVPVPYRHLDHLARHTQAAENKSRKVDMLRVAKDAVPDIGLGP